MSIFNVNYTVYRPNSGEVLSEGTIPVNTSTSYQAEQTVKAMFGINDVMIRYVTCG